MGVLVNTLPKLIEVMDILEPLDALSFDCETTGLHAFHGDKTFSYIFSTKDEDYYIDLNIAGIPKSLAIPQLARLFKNPDRKIFGVNILFDLVMIHFDGITSPKGRFIDAPALARVEYNLHRGAGGTYDGSFLSMDYLAKHYLGKEKDDTVKNYIRENNLYGVCHVTGDKKPLYDQVPLEIMMKYGFSDGRITYDLTRRIIQKINQKDLDYSPYRGSGIGKLIEIAKNEIELTSTLLDIKKDGFRIDREYINMAIELEEKAIKESIGEIEKELGKDFKYGSSDKVAKMLIEKNVPIEFNDPTPNMLKRGMKAKADIAELHKETAEIKNKEEQTKRDSKRLATICKKIEQLHKSHYKNMKGNPKADAKALKKYAEKYDIPILNKIISTKQSEKKVTTYYKNYLKLSDINNVIHCGLNQEVAVTGRFSSSNPNLQNVGKEVWKEYDKDGNLIKTNVLLVRNSFIAFENHRLFFIDFQQQEMIVMLDQAGEMDVINKLKSGEFSDFYLATAAVVKEKSGMEITRAQAKAIALGLAYGQGKALLAKNLGVTLEKAQAIITAFFSALPKLKIFKDNLESYARRFGRIHNPFGRVLYIEKGYEYKALNAYIQSTAADITKRAMVAIGKEFAAQNITSRISLVIHDEVATNIKTGEEKLALTIIGKCMTEAYPAKHIKLGVDFEVSEINERGVSPWAQKIPYKLAV